MAPQIVMVEGDLEGVRERSRTRRTQIPKLVGEQGRTGGVAEGTSSSPRSETGEC